MLLNMGGKLCRCTIQMKERMNEQTNCKRGGGQTDERNVTPGKTTRMQKGGGKDEQYVTTGKTNGMQLYNIMLCS